MILATGSSKPEGPGELVSFSRSWMVASCDGELCGERSWASTESDVAKNIAMPANEDEMLRFLIISLPTRELYASGRLHVTFLGRCSGQFCRWKHLHSRVSLRNARR